MMSIPRINDIPDEERTPLVLTLLEVIHVQQEQIQLLKDEVARLKGHSRRPSVQPSRLERPRKKRGGRRGSTKAKALTIHETKVIRPGMVPDGSRFKGYDDYIIQGLVIKAHNVRYRLERWLTPHGDYVVGNLPDGAGCGHFSVELISYILYQHYHAHVTQPLILEQLHEFGIDISAGQLSNIITEGKENFHAEKEEILNAGLDVSSYIHVDDTGARHNGTNGYCTHIGNELFAWFESTESKSRINFLKILRAGNSDYVLNEDAIEYMRTQKMPQYQLGRFFSSMGLTFEDDSRWHEALCALDITAKRHIRIATEGALLGSIFKHGMNPRLIIISDDAGQFKVFLHALCWIHAERTLAKLVGFNDNQRKDLEKTRNEVWKFYAGLKAYKQSPCPPKRKEIEARFNEIFTNKTCFASLNQALKRIHKNKAELLLVLEYPDIPLHNNLSEQDIREYVKKRKISGSTRSESGRRCRDTFTSLKKTCRKLDISFWNYLKDRISHANAIPWIPHLIRLLATEHARQNYQLAQGY